MHRKLRLTVFGLAALGLFACSAPIRQASGENPGVRHLRILQVNDTYKVEGLEKGTLGGFARLRSLRR